MRVAEPAVAAVQEHDALAGLVEVGQQGLAVLINDLRADGDLDDQRGGVGAGAVLTRRRYRPSGP